MHKILLVIMSFFKSALDYVNNGVTQMAERSDDPFVGSCVELGDMKLYVSSTIAEGMLSYMIMHIHTMQDCFLPLGKTRGIVIMMLN